MAAMFGSVCVTMALLVCVHGGVLRITEPSGHPPFNLSVACWCTSYPVVTVCSWPEPSEPSLSPPPHYVATYSERRAQAETKPCHLIPPSSPSSAVNSSASSEQLWHCQLPNLKLLTDYIINVTAVYSSGNSSHQAIFMLEDIVKPDPPADVRVSPHNIKDLLVEWSPPPTWANLDIFPLKYQIKYQWENRGILKPVELGPFENTNLELKGLTPGREYLFQVCAKELLGLGECSNWSSPVNITIPRTKP